MTLSHTDWLTWAQAWANTYPPDADKGIEALHSPQFLDRDGWEVVVAWKFGSGDARRLRNAERALAATDYNVLEDVSAAARSCRDDDFAMRLIRTITGVGTALGSSALMTMDPHRFTVIDERALASCLSGIEMPPRGR